MEGKKYLRLNVSGQHFKLPARLISERFPTTRLGLLAASVENAKPPESAVADGLAFDFDDGEFYVFRSATCFSALVTYCQTKKLHRPIAVCEYGLEEELEFWGFSGIPKCQDCSIAFDSRRPSCLTLSRSAGSLTISDDAEANGHLSPPEKKPIEEKLEITPKREKLTKYGRIKKLTWDIVEDPSSSKAAMAFCGLSVVFILATVVVSTLESLPSFQQEYEDCVKDEVHKNASTNNTIKVPRCGRGPVLGLAVADVLCMAWFSLEYLLRMWSAPNRWDAFKRPLNLIDLLAIIPFYVELLITLRSPFARTQPSHSLVQSAQSGRVLRVFRVMRSLRMLKFARYSSDIRLLGLALKRSLSELLMIMVYVIFATYFYSTLLYQFEADAPGTSYGTIPSAAWWTMATAFTYSDSPPKTLGAKLVASTGFVAGVLLLAFPITVLVDKFSKIYQEKFERRRGRRGLRMNIRNAMSTTAGIERRMIR